MALALTIPGDAVIQGNLLLIGGITNGIARSSITAEGAKLHPLRLEGWRIWDSMGPLTTSAGSDDLGIYHQTFGTGCPYIGTGDVKNGGSITRYARMLMQIPYNYVAAGAVSIEALAGMITTVASASATIDFEVYKRNSTDSLVTGSDLVTTSATSINSLTWAQKSFALTSTSLAPGDWLDILMTIATNDSATGTAVIAAVVPSLALTVQG